MSRDVFSDNLEFMNACDKKIPQRPTLDYPTESMQFGLIEEEFKELLEAREQKDLVEVFDACIDIIKVVLEYGESCGFNMSAGWNEVHRSNMSKVVDGKVIRREDGKILKPETYSPPNLTKVLLKGA